jgi:hypothetical protein
MLPRPGCTKEQGHHGQVNCAAPKILSCEPPSGFIFEEDPVPARTVAVPVKPGTHCANPFWSTVAPGFMFPTHMPLFEPTHHVTALLVSCTGDGGLLKAPLAANETWPLGKFSASADVGVRATDCNWRPLPQPAIPSETRGSTRKSGRKPKHVMAVSLLLHSKESLFLVDARASQFAACPAFRRRSRPFYPTLGLLPRDR